MRERTEEVAVYLSRLTFATLPGHTRQVEEQLRRLRDLVAQAGGTRVRVPFLPISVRVRRER